ncbi:tumor protein p53-inducible protein 13-like [Xenopus laevis]|uniref:Tumor protein p53-inducible protein 13-like n=1 Tax=Xenopus laevis TaxID=8355 RepID=A0A8J1M642_XENLA|nr:tumor protein p53-inducible protein 13-like [Xenopus laevis]
MRQLSSVVPLLLSSVIAASFGQVCDNGWVFPSITTHYEPEHGGVVFLYHPCVHPKLKKALVHGARSCVYKHIITPHMNLSTERFTGTAFNTWPITDIGGFAPLALVTWGSTLEMSHIDLCEVRNWLTANMDRTREREMDMDGSDQDLLVRPSSVFFDKHDKKLCPKVCCQVHVKLDPSGVSEKKDYLVDPDGSRYMESNVSALLPESTFMNISKGSPDMNLNSPTVQSRNTSNDLGGSQTVPSPTSMQKESGASTTHNNSIAGKTTVEGPGTATTTQQEYKIPEPPVGLSSTTATKPTATVIEEKEECSCKHEPTKEASAAAQKASGVGQIKASDLFVSTPRTEEAAWAAACLTFLFVLLTLSVLYTQLYKKFRKSQSLYWPPEGIAAETETVASVVKRRLMPGHSKRKKWIKHKKTPVLLYESLRESSE